MPLYDYECERCTRVGEYLMNANDDAMIACPKCSGLMTRIMSLGRASVFADEAPWVRSVLEVVDKESDKLHVKEFLASPTRSNYRKWLKAEGLRPFEPGEQRDNRAFRKRLEEEFPKHQADAILKIRQEQNRIEV